MVQASWTHFSILGDHVGTPGGHFWSLEAYFGRILVRLRCKHGSETDVLSCGVFLIFYVRARLDKGSGDDVGSLEAQFSVDFDKILVTLHVVEAARPKTTGHGRRTLIIMVVDVWQ